MKLASISALILFATFSAHAANAVSVTIDGTTYSCSAGGSGSSRALL